MRRRLRPAVPPLPGQRGGVRRRRAVADLRTGITVYDAYGASQATWESMFAQADVDTVVFDIQDVGARFYTYIWTMYTSMLAAARVGKRYVVLDRPNPIGGRAYGPMMTPAYSSGVGLREIVQQHGMTVGELARLFTTEFLPAAGRSVDLHVVRCRHWKRDRLAADTDLPWVMPSPNMPTSDTALVYPGTGLFEGVASITEGRGTCRPFELIGRGGRRGRRVGRRAGRVRPAPGAVPALLTVQSIRRGREPIQADNRIPARVRVRLATLGCGPHTDIRGARHADRSAMPATSRPPVLHLVVSGTEPVAELEPFITACQQLGWEVHLIADPDAADTMDLDALADLTHHPAHADDQVPAALPEAEAYAVAPASFDLVNRWAYGFNDNLALRLLNEATSVGLPLLVVPVPDPALARHPAFLENLERMRHWGVVVTGAAEAGDPTPWRAAVQVVAEWTRFARVPARLAALPAEVSAQPPELPTQPLGVPVRPLGEQSRGADELALQSG
nr:exo-beta-N-acetylmuramidase NamZ domain-containing protein [Micromonospora thermarum]